MSELKSLYFTTTGRLDIPRFWMATAGLFLACVLAALVPVVGQAVALAALWPWTCLIMKRLRDAGRSPRLALAPIAACAVVAGLSLVLQVIALNAALALATLGFAAVVALISVLVGLAVLGFLLWAGLAPSRP